MYAHYDISFPRILKLIHIEMHSYANYTLQENPNNDGNVIKA